MSIHRLTHLRAAAAASAALLLGGCGFDPMTMGAMWAGSHLVSGVIGASETAKTPAERISDQVGDNCATFRFTSSGPSCTSVLPDAGPAGIRNLPPSGPAQSASAVTNPPGYEQCMYEKIVLGRSAGGC